MRLLPSLLLKFYASFKDSKADRNNLWTGENLSGDSPEASQRKIYLIASLALDAWIVRGVRNLLVYNPRLVQTFRKRYTKA